MNFSVNPLNFKSMKINTPTEKAAFLDQLSQFLSQVSNVLSGLPSNLASLMTTNSKNLGVLSVSSTFNVAGSLISSARFSFSANLVLHITNLPPGAIIFLIPVVTGGVARTLELTATDPLGNTYTTIFADIYNNGFDMIGTGLNVGASFNFFYRMVGVSTSDFRLEFAAV
jgi:hypothetical protein